jgi:hypothetical protein
MKRWNSFPKDLVAIGSSSNYAKWGIRKYHIKFWVLTTYSHDCSREKLGNNISIIVKPYSQASIDFIATSIKEYNAQKMIYSLR